MYLYQTALSTNPGLYVSIIFLSIMLLSSLLYAYRHQGIEKNLLKIIYYDYRGYDRDIIKSPEDYFIGPQGVPIKPSISIMKTGIKTTSPEEHHDNILQLRENHQDPIATDREHIHINSSGDENEQISKEEIQIDSLSSAVKGMITIPDYEEIQIDSLSSAVKGMITIPDYEELPPDKILKLDKRTTLTYLKDLMILDHAILSLVFRKSLKDPLFIRVLQTVFSLSMQFAINAMLYTDNVIDERQSKLATVTI
jgi:hypothetical protein